MPAMWTITNNTPFATERTWVRARNGAEVWLVGVKATFDISPDGELQLAEEQLPVTLFPEYAGDPAASSLAADADMQLAKPHTDILVQGHAYAPRGQAVEQIDVSLSVDLPNRGGGRPRLEKRIRVFGDRTWEEKLMGMRPGPPQPFHKMPLVYERAYGGENAAVPEGDSVSEWDVRNPVGQGFALSESNLAGKPLPNLEDPNQLLTRWNQRPDPRAFGPVAPHWDGRARFAGTYDKAWETERRPLLPNDFDERFFQASPEDQWSNEPMRGGEVVELTNMTPDGLLRFTLPRIRLAFQTFYFDFDLEPQYHEAPLSTVLVLADLPCLIMVWCSRLECHHDGHKLLTTEVDLKQSLRDDERYWQPA